MSVTIQDRIVAYGHGALNPSYFCVHSTANIGATAANHVSYWGNNPDYAVHLVSDWNECFHTVPYNALCWQVGNGNAYVEGIEICEAANYDDFMRGIDIAADVVAQRLTAHGWGIERLICHDEARRLWGGTDHTDPIPYFNRFSYTWQEFKNLVDTKMKGEIDMTVDELMNAPIAVQDSDGDGQHNTTVWQTWSWAYRYAQSACQMLNEVKVQNAALTETVKTLAENMGANPDEVAAKVAAAVEKKLESIDLSVTVD